MATLKPVTKVSAGLKGLLNDAIAREIAVAFSTCGSMCR